ncbi:hypothetical protein OHA27_27380 [Streptomyces sp. NBC_01619]|uniref:hypothetical protein n=1 Tax=Streptomyces sp. NBC_01619 TaxID=2975901 RepID=UPI0022574645|nr:hypothetical protein [Streptomyces sp. NBC_01619]MCX4513977.1 hypothetical protein [Streptomyces sp. NBC_01619]
MSRWRTALTTVSAAALAAVLLAPAPAHAAPGDPELAYRWAPVHYQDSSSSNYRADYLAPVDYDGNWNALDNWDNLDAQAGGLKGTVYYAVSETSTHWYLTYAFFHPRDWKDSPLNVFSHENDMEGQLEVVRKDGSEYGTLEAVVTLAHDNFYSYTPPGSPFTDGQENIDATLVMQSFDGNEHPTSFQEARGHGAYAWDGAQFPGGDGIVYRPSRGAGAVPAGGDDRDATYGLVDLTGAGSLWERRSNAETYASWGTFRGDNGKDNAAHAPWAWDDGNDGSALQAGAIVTDPALLVSTYFDNTGELDLTYLRNPFRS